MIQYKETQNGEGEKDVQNQDILPDSLDCKIIEFLSLESTKTPEKNIKNKVSALINKEQVRSLLPPWAMKISHLLKSMFALEFQGSVAKSTFMKLFLESVFTHDKPSYILYGRRKEESAYTWYIVSETEDEVEAVKKAFKEYIESNDEIMGWIQSEKEKILSFLPDWAMKVSHCLESFFAIEFLEETTKNIFVKKIIDTILLDGSLPYLHQGRRKADMGKSAWYISSETEDSMEEVKNMFKQYIESNDELMKRIQKKQQKKEKYF